MRQAGIIAAAGIFALQHNVERIAEDHAAAQQLAAGLANTLGIEVEPVETNIVFFDVSKTNLDARQFTAHLAKLGVRVGPCGPTRVRAVTHLDVTMQDIDSALTAIQNLIS